MNKEILRKISIARVQGKADKSRKLARGLLKSKNPEDQTEGLAAIGLSYKMEGKKKESLKYFNKALEKSLDNNNFFRAGGISRDIGTAYLNSGAYPIAEKFLNQSIKYLSKYSEYKSNLGISISKRGLSKLQSGHKKEALKDLELGVKTILSDKEPVKFWLMTAKLHLALGYMENKQLKKSSAILSECQSESLKNKWIYRLIQTKFLQGIVDYKLKDKQKSLEDFYQGIILIDLFDSEDLKSNFIKRLRSEVEKYCPNQLLKINEFIKKEKGEIN